MGHVIRKMLIRSYLAKDLTNSIPQSISFDPNMTLWIKMPKNWDLGKSFS